MRLRFIVLILALLVLVSTVSGGYMFFSSLRNHEKNRLLQHIEMETETIASFVNTYVAEYQTAVKALAGMDDIRQAMLSQNDTYYAEATDVLDIFRESLAANACYIMNNEGTAVLSSYRNQQRSLSSHPVSHSYFKTGSTGKEVAYFTPGASFAQRGISFSHPIFSGPQSTFVGVAVLQAPLDLIDRYLDGYSKSIVLLANPDGIILSSNRSSWIFKMLWKTSQEKMKELSEKNQFGSGKGLWEWTGLDLRGNNLAADENGKEYLVQQAGIAAYPEWKIVYLHDLDLMAKNLYKPFIRSVGCLILTLCLFTGLVVNLLYRKANTIIAGRQKKESKLVRQLQEKAEALKTANQDLSAEFDKHKAVERELKKNYQTLTILNRLLTLSLENIPLPVLLDQFIKIVTTFPGLALTPRGAIFLKDEDSDSLLLTAQHNLAQPLISICRKIEFGTCLCGRTAQTREVVFSSHLDDSHDIRYQGMEEHGHYCIPIISSNEKLLGVFTLYIDAGYQRDHRAEEILVSIAGVVAGIIERKKTEEALAHEKNKLESLFAAMDDGVTVQDTDFRIIYQNQPHILRQGDHLGEICYQAYRQRDSVCEDCVLEECFQDGKVRRGHTTSESNGETLHFDVSASPIKNSAGKTVAGIEVFRDITEFKRLSAKLQQAQKMEAIGTLAGGVAHDFNNILSAILGYTDLAKQKIPSGEIAAEYLEEVIIAGTRAKELVKQILAFSRQSDMPLQPVRLSLMVKEAIKLMRASMPSIVEIKQEISPESGSIMATPAQIHQIMMNLCANAFHAMKDEGGTLEVLLGPVTVDAALSERNPDLSEGIYEKLTVKDSGRGINPGIIDRIFDPYFTTKGPDEGSGMGLSVTHGIVRELGGAITVESVPGQGTSFDVYLPQIIVKEDNKPAEPTAVMATGNEHILFVDDEEPLVRIARKLLENLGYGVTVKTSSVEALDFFRLKSDSIDLLVTDQMMPKITGFKLAEEARKIKPRVPVIVISGFNDAKNQKLAASHGIDAFLYKPVVKEELAQTIRNVLDEGKIIPQ